MKGRLLVALTTAAAFVCAIGAGDRPGEGSKAAPGVAIVELFTSEGCNSCPPADELAAALASEARAQRGVHVLVFHVEQWDYLGWPDRFAAKAHDQRHRAYAQALGGGKYTPEMVVNGGVAFVGSDGARARREITRVLAEPAQVKTEVVVGVRKAGEPVRVEVTLSGAPAGTIVNAAVVEDGLSSDVKRGENAGRVLKHERVVRAFESGAPSLGRAALELKLPKGLEEASANVVVWAQDGKSLRVLGAIETSLLQAHGKNK